MKITNQAFQCATLQILVLTFFVSKVLAPNGAELRDCSYVLRCYIHDVQSTELDKHTLFMKMAYGFTVIACQTRNRKVPSSSPMPTDSANHFL